LVSAKDKVTQCLRFGCHVAGISNIAFYGIKRPVDVIVSVRIAYHRLDITNNPFIRPNH